MFRKAAALPVVIAALLVGSATPAFAPPPMHRVHVDETQSVINCGDVTGGIKWTPHLHSGAGSGAVTATVNLTLGSCTGNAPPGVIEVSKGRIRGTFSESNVGCLGLFSTSSGGSGTLTARWTYPKFFKFGVEAVLASNVTVATVNSTTGGTLMNGDDYLAVPGAFPNSSTGSFSGTNGGASDALNVDVGPSSTITAECSSQRGLRHLTIQSGTASFG